MNRKLLVAFAAVPLFVAVLPACGKGKIEQCNAFIDRANAAQNTINALKLDSDDSKKLEAEAVKIESEAKAVKGVELKDEKLVKFRDDYATSLGKLAGNVKELAKLHADAKSPDKQAAVEASAKKLEADADKIEKEESKLVAEINSYCSAK